MKNDSSTNTGLALKDAEVGMPVAELCHKYGSSDATLYHLKTKFAGMTISKAQRLRSLKGGGNKLGDCRQQPCRALLP